MSILCSVESCGCAWTCWRQQGRTLWCFCWCCHRLHILCGRLAGTQAHDRCISRHTLKSIHSGSSGSRHRQPGLCKAFFDRAAEPPVEQVKSVSCEIIEHTQRYKSDLVTCGCWGLHHVFQIQGSASLHGVIDFRRDPRTLHRPGPRVARLLCALCCTENCSLCPIQTMTIAREHWMTECRD